MKSVLVIEDDHDTRVSLRQTLEAEGYQVISATNGNDAIKLLSQIKPPSVVLLDLMMPMMNGWEFLERQKSKLKEAGVPVVVITAYPYQRVEYADALVCKPLERDSLLRLIGSMPSNAV